MNKNHNQTESDTKEPTDQQIEAGKPIELKVGASIKQRRIDKYLHGRFSNYSRVMIQNIIKAGTVKVNGQIIKQSFKLTPNDKIELTLPELPSKEIEPQDIPLDIIYEDQDLIVINKQPDMIVHPARSYRNGTLVNALAYYSDSLSDGSAEFRPGIVHRLDKNTTGVMVIAKNNIAQWKISKQFAERTTRKTYLAIAQGTPELTADCINLPLSVHPRAREKYAVCPGTGKEAVTFYEVIEEFKGYSLLKLKPRTGRTHQLRVHLSYMKHPIVADDMYGGKLVYPWQLKNTEPAVEEPIINRTALHAHTLEFTHPTTEESVKFEAPLPDDIKNLRDMLRKYRKI